jgi:hypothetical protein
MGVTMQPQRLVEREPGCPHVPRQHVLLLDCRVETEPERGMARHSYILPSHIHTSMSNDDHEAIQYVRMSG